jgi:hypothetical protein
MISTFQATERLEPGHRRHCHVEYRDVNFVARPKDRNLLNRFFAVARFSDYPDVFLTFEQ